MDYKKTGEFLKSLRKAKGYTQDQVALKLMVTPKTISKWETGLGMPDINILTSVAEFYGVTVDDILMGQKKLEENKVQSVLKTEVPIIQNKLSKKFDIYYYISWGLLGLFYILGVIFLFYQIQLSVFFIGLFFLSPLIVLWLGNIDYKKNKSDDPKIQEAINNFNNQIRKKEVIISFVFGILFIIYFIFIKSHETSDISGIFLINTQFFGSLYFFTVFSIFCYLIYRNDNHCLRGRIINAIYVSSTLTLILTCLLSSTLYFEKYNTPNSWASYNLTIFELIFFHRDATDASNKFNYFYTLISFIPFLITVTLFGLSFKFKKLKYITGFVSLSCISCLYISSIDIMFLKDIRRNSFNQLITFKIYYQQILIAFIALAFYIYFVRTSLRIERNKSK